MAVVSFMQFPEADFWRITFSLGLTCLFAMIFAWLVGKLQQELTRLATTDPLTGCLNRSQLADILNGQIQMRERYERVSSLVLPETRQRQYGRSEQGGDLVGMAEPAGAGCMVITGYWPQRLRKSR